MSERVVEYPFLKRFVNPEDYVLDVGPGNHPEDRTTDVLKKIGVKLVSVDPSVDGVHYGDFYRESILETSLQGFDVISCISTFEHIPQSAEASDALYKVLKCGGRLVLSVPAGKFGSYWHPGCGENMYLFDVSTLRSLFPETLWQWKTLEFYKGISENDWVQCSEKDADEGKIFPVDRIIAICLQKICA